MAVHSLKKIWANGCLLTGEFLFAGLDHLAAAEGDEGAEPEAVVRSVQASLESVGTLGRDMIARFLEPLSTGLFSEVPLLLVFFLKKIMTNLFKT